MRSTLKWLSHNLPAMGLFVALIALWQLAVTTLDIREYLLPGPLAVWRALVGDALRLLRVDVALIPLYRRHHNWVMRPDIDALQWPNDMLELRWVTLR